MSEQTTNEAPGATDATEAEAAGPLGGAKEGRAASRREMVWALCNKLAAEGAKPTLRNVRQLGGARGSDTDVHQDIQEWFAKVFADHLDRAGGRGIPEPVSALASEIWALALSNADSTVEQKRAEADGAQRQAAEHVAQVDAKLLDMRDELELLRSQLDNALGRADRLAESLARTEGELGEAKTQAAARQERIESLLAEGAQRAREAADALEAANAHHARELAAERAESDRKLAELRETHGEQVRQLEERERIAAERFRAIERRALLDIDNARSESAQWKEKAQSERVTAQAREDQVRQQLTAAREAAAAAQERERAVRDREEDLREQLARSQKERDDALRSAAVAEALAAAAAASKASGGAPEA